MQTSGKSLDNQTNAAPSTFRAWYILALLCLLFALSFIDRNMLALVVTPVSDDLNIGDRQIGLLLGAGFAVVYAIGGLPLAHLIDQYQRRMILIVGICFWSLCTILTAFVTSFAALALCRAGVAVGEAVLTPAAVSLIADLFVKEKRALPISFYGAIGAVMGVGSFIVGAAALQMATVINVDGFAAWRLAFILIGIPGFGIALLLLLTVQEPERTGSKEIASGQSKKANTGEFFNFLVSQRRFFIPYYLATGLWAMCSLGMVLWLPTFLVRGFAVDPAQAGYLFGAVGATAALTGTLFWPQFANRKEKAGRKDGIVWAYFLSTIIGTPLIILAPLSSSLPMLLILYALGITMLSTGGSLTPMAMQAYGPQRMRGRLMALSLMFTSLVGYMVGPSLTEYIASFWGTDPFALGYGLAIMSAIGGTLSIILLHFARRALLTSDLLEHID